MRLIAMNVDVCRRWHLPRLVLILLAAVSRSRADDASPKPASPAAVESDDRTPNAAFKRIRGSVVDEADKPVAGARLWLPLLW